MDESHFEKITPYLALIKMPYLDIGGDTIYINVYLLMDKELALIDTGPCRKGSRQLLESALSEFGFRLKDISRIIYTHAHPDHMGGGVDLGGKGDFSHLVYWEALEYVEQYGRYVNLFKSLCKETLSPHLQHNPKERDTYFNLVDAFWYPAYGQIKFDHGLHDGDTINTGDLNLEVISTPGHSPWDISLWEEKERMLFTGDFILEKSSTLTGSMKGLGSDLIAYKSSLEKVSQYVARAKYVFPSHGTIIRSGKKLADNLLNIIRWRENIILEQLNKKRCSLVYLTSLFVSFDNSIGFVRQVGVTLTHLEKLQREGKVISSQEDGMILYGLSSHAYNG